MVRLSQVDFDGRKALDQILKESCYGSLKQTVASLTIFIHPETVIQTKCKNIFSLVRGGDRDQFNDERRVIYDDNAGPHAAFVGAAGLEGFTITGKKDLQLNHIWGLANDVRYHTCLANLCVTPSFLAKLTDHSQEVQDCLKFRAYELYSWHPQMEDKPKPPQNYQQLKWAEPLKFVKELGKIYRKRMQGFDNRVVNSAKQYGWFFSDWQSDKTL